MHFLRVPRDLRSVFGRDDLRQTLALHELEARARGDANPRRFAISRTKNTLRDLLAPCRYHKACDVPATACDVRATFVRRAEARDEAERFLGRVRPSRRLLFWLRYGHGLTLPELAARLSIGRTAVSERLRREWARLRMDPASPAEE